MTAEDTVIAVDFTRRRRDTSGQTRELFTIKEVGDRCGLPGPVIMQLVPRTWTPRGWMYTAEQIDAAIATAHRLRRERQARDGSASGPACGQVVQCCGCGRTERDDTPAYRLWLHVSEPDSSTAPPQPGPDYCPRCLVVCPACQGRGDRACETCWDSGRVPARR